MAQTWEDRATGVRALLETQPYTGALLPGQDDMWQGQVTLVDPNTHSNQPVMKLAVREIGPLYGTEWAVVEEAQQWWNAQVAGIQAENADYRHLRHTEYVYEGRDRDGDGVRVGLEIIPSSQGFRYSLEFWWPGDSLPRPPKSPNYTNWRTCAAAGLAALQTAITARGGDVAAIYQASAPRGGL